MILMLNKSKLITAFVVICLLTAPHIVAAQDDQQDEIGVYTLVNVDGIELPATVSHDDVEIKVHSGTFTFNADGTCESNVLFGPPSRDPITRKVTADYSRDGDEVKMNWHGAGKTVGTLKGDRFSMNNEGMIFNYEKQPTPPPEKMQSVLDHFLGSWKSVHKQVPDGDEFTVKLTYHRVLGDKYVKETGEVDGEKTALAMFTYDADNQCYRMWHFSAEHKTSEGKGSWDPQTTTLTWTAVNLANPEVTMTTRHRFVADNRFDWDVVGKDKSGKQIFRLEGTATRISDSEE